MQYAARGVARYLRADMYMIGYVASASKRVMAEKDASVMVGWNISDMVVIQRITKVCVRLAHLQTKRWSSTKQRSKRFIIVGRDGVMSDNG